MMTVIRILTVIVSWDSHIILLMDLNGEMNTLKSIWLVIISIESLILKYLKRND